MTPIYTATEIKQMAGSLSNLDAIKILAGLIDEELDLYSQEDVIILMQASTILFTRSLLLASMKL